SGGGEVRDERPVPGGGERERERVRAEYRERAAERGGDGAGRGGEHGGETVGRELVRPESAGAVVGRALDGDRRDPVLLRRIGRELDRALHGDLAEGPGTVEHGSAAEPADH